MATKNHIDWSKFSTELRLKYGDFEQTVDKTPAHVKKAIEDCAEINASPKKWAKLSVLPTPSAATVYLEVGNILSGGFVETKAQTWYYTKEKNGEVTVYKHTHR